MKVMILANIDPTTSTIFRPVCEDSRLEVRCVAFTRTLTKSKGFWRGVYDIFRCSGFGYFAYVSFWNGIFLAKEWLIWHLPLVKRVFGKFFSLKLWAMDRGVEVVSSHDFNSPEFLEVIARHGPDVLFTRINQLLKEPILKSTPCGCLSFHSSQLPRYQGIAAEFHSLLNGEKTIGFSVMQMEHKLDVGPVIAQGTTHIPQGCTLHRLIEHNNAFAHEVIRKAVEQLLTGQINCEAQDLSKKSYHSWPTPEQTRLFRQKGLRYVSVREALAYVWQ